MGIITLPLFLLVVAVFAALAFWVVGFKRSNNISVPTKSIDFSKIKKILVVYPHPDDEVLSVGGLIKSMESRDTETKLLILTKGENYSENAPRNVKEIRSKELEKSASILGFNSLEHLDLGDGKLKTKTEQVLEAVKKSVKEFKPDLLITFDQSGLYGHPDHIVTSKVVTEISHKEKIELWYNTLPQKVLNQIKLPEHMADDETFKDSRVLPTHKFNCGVSGIIARTRALYAHESQLDSFRNSLPIRWVPLWVYSTFRPYEYYHSVENSSTHKG